MGYLGFLIHLIWNNNILYWDFDLKSWIVDFFTHFTWEKTPQNNFSSQNFSVENNYFIILNSAFHTSIILLLGLGLLNNDMISTWKVKMQLKDSQGNYPLKQHKKFCKNWFRLLDGHAKSDSRTQYWIEISICIIFQHIILG